MVGAPALIETLGSPVQVGDTVESVVLKVPNARVSSVTELVSPDRRHIQSLLVGTDRIRYDPFLEDLIRRTSTFAVGRHLGWPGAKELTPEAVRFVDGVVQTARQVAPASFTGIQLAALLDVRYVDEANDIYDDSLPHPDYVNSYPTILGLGSVAVGDDYFDPTHFYNGSYVYQGDSRQNRNITQYVETVLGLDEVEAEADAMYVGDGRVMLHAGPANVSEPRVVARVFAAALEPDAPLNCYN